MALLLNESRYPTLPYLHIFPTTVRIMYKYFIIYETFKFQSVSYNILKTFKCLNNFSHMIPSPITLVVMKYFYFSIPTYYIICLMENKTKILFT